MSQLLIQHPSIPPGIVCIAADQRSDSQKTAVFAMGGAVWGGPHDEGAAESACPARAAKAGLEIIEETESLLLETAAIFNIFLSE